MKGQKLIFSLLFFGIGFSSLSVYAEKDIDSTQLNDVTLEDLMHLEVKSTSKQSQKQYEAPGIVSVISKDQMKDYGYFNLNDAVYHEAGFFPSQDFERHTIGSRGLFESWNNNHLLLLVDGVALNDPMYGSAYGWDNTPTFFIKSVEVGRGPGSALYGTNATNGILAIQTLSGSDMNGRMEAQIRAGSYGSVWTTAATGNSRDNVDYFFGFNSFTTNGPAYSSYDLSGGSLTKYSVNNANSSEYFFAKILGKNDLAGFSLQFHEQQWSFHSGIGWNFAIPDFADSLSQRRQVVTASYTSTAKSNLHTEYTVKYERNELDWLMRDYPNGYSGYPQGVSEYINMAHQNLFARAQGSYDLRSKSNILGGIETSTFLYNGDRAHYSNTDLADVGSGSYEQPNANNAWASAPATLGLIKNKPLTNIGVYTQYMSGDVFSHQFQLTAGLRYDLELFDYDPTLAAAINQLGSGHRTFTQVSPRLAAVIQPSERLSYKILLGKAFRAPSPSELGSISTWLQSSSPTTLAPETVTNFEVGVDYRPIENLNYKANAYLTKAENQIGYASNATSITNISTSTTAGLEATINYTKNKTKGYANAAYSKRVAEEISDPTITKNESDVTWAPALTANVGATQTLNAKLKGTLQVSYLGEQKRRESDNATAANVAARGSSVAAFTTVDGSLLYQPAKSIDVNFYVKNIFDTEGYLIKNHDAPFDYPINGRTFYASLSLSY